ncbi:MAG: alpha/beta fold hydrolase [bacterium]
MNIMKRVLLIIVFIITMFVIAFWGRLFGTSYTPKITDENGDIIPGSIASLEKINIGGMEQSILIRGNDINNPILLWLHGGPGSSQMPIAHKYDKKLEKEFIMIHWDQRGSGKSNPSNFNENTMTYDQFIADGHQLTKYLKERFDEDKIYLLGHSWGTQLGIELVGRYPEDYYSYISVSQVINQDLHHEIGYLWLVEQIQKKGKEEDIKKLKKLGDPPFTKHDEFVTFIKMVDAYGGSFDIPFSNLIRIALKSQEYTFKDYLAWLKGSNRGSGKMWSEVEYSSFNAIEKFPELDLPVFFFMGKHDYNTPLKATNKYFHNLIAPRGKQLIIFEESSHTPFLAEPEKFVKELIKVKNETYN